MAFLSKRNTQYVTSLSDRKMESEGPSKTMIPRMCLLCPRLNLCPLYRPQRKQQTTPRFGVSRTHRDSNSDEAFFVVNVFFVRSSLEFDGHDLVRKNRAHHDRGLNLVTSRFPAEP